MEGRNERKKMSSIFDNCHATASQEIFLRSCGFAQRGLPPDSDPSVLGTSPLRDSEADSVINSRYGDEELVESHAVRFVSPPESPNTIDPEEDRTVPVESKADSIPSEEKSPNLLPKKLKIPLRDVVRAIVINSRSTEEEDEEEDREIEKKKKTSCVQILIQKGFNFP